MRRFLFVLAGGFLLSGGLLAQPAGAPAGDLRLVVLVSRHGVRAPTKQNGTDMALYSAEPPPAWDVPFENLTPRGYRQMQLMGAYYRALYVRAGLLTGRTEQDADRIYFVADSDERTIDSARAMADALLPGASPAIHAQPNGERDPLFRPQSFTEAQPDTALAIASVRGRIGGDLAVLTPAFRPEFDLLERVLLGGDGTRVPPGRQSVLDLPCSYGRGGNDEVIGFSGPVHKAESLIDNLMLEYCENMPMDQVGWGRMGPADLTQLLRLHELYFDLTQRSFYPAQVQMSNMLSHILQTMERVATGRPQPGGFGGAGTRLVIVQAHDSNQASLGGLLGVDWCLPGTQMNPMLPGGALAFELRRRGDGPWTVRLRYLAQSLEQIRDLQPLDLDHPPQSADILVPDASGGSPGYDVPFARFEALARRVIDPAYVIPGDL